MRDDEGVGVVNLPALQAEGEVVVVYVADIAERNNRHGDRPLPPKPTGDSKESVRCRCL